MYAVLRYLWHWLTAVNEHSLHSPFLYDLYTKTIKKKASYEDLHAIEQLRQELIHSKKTIIVKQLGASSRVNNENVRPLSAIAGKGITSSSINKITDVYYK